MYLLTMNIIKNSFLSCYALGKNFLDYTPNGKTEHLQLVKKILSIIFGVGLLIIYIPFILPFMIFHKCLHVILKIVHGESYGGFLSGMDMSFEMKPEKIIMNVVMIFTCLDDSCALIEQLKHCVHQLHQSSYKFRSEIRTVLGYQYFLKNRVSIDEVIEVKRFDSNTHMTRENLLDYLETKSSVITTNQLWKALFFSQPILWNTQKKHKQFAVVLTFRHALGDFPSILGFIKKHFQFTENTNVKHMEPNTYDVEINLDNACILFNPLLFSSHEIQRLNNEKYFVATYIEEKAAYISKVKRIKEKMNATFVEVFTAAIASSIQEHASQRNIEIRNLPMATIVRPIKDHEQEILNGTYNFQVVENSFGVLVYNIPCNSKEIPLETLKDIVYRYRTSKYSMDGYMIYSVFHYSCTYLPKMLIDLFCQVLTGKLASVVSNVVGLTGSTCCGNPIDDIFFYVPSLYNIGNNFFIHSYAGRIQLTAASKSGFVRNRQELQQIVDNVFKKIDELAE